MIAVPQLRQEVRLDEIEDSFWIGDDAMREMLLAKGLFLLRPKEILKFLLIVLAECELSYCLLTILGIKERNLFYCIVKDYYQFIKIIF